MEEIVIDYNNNSEEYNELMRAIGNVEIFCGISSVDNKIEIDNDYYDSYEDNDSGYNSDVENYLHRPQRIYNPDDFISDHDSEAEPDEGVQEDIDSE